MKTQAMTDKEIRTVLENLIKEDPEKKNFETGIAYSLLTTDEETPISFSKDYFLPLIKYNDLNVMTYDHFSFETEEFVNANINNILPLIYDYMAKTGKPFLIKGEVYRCLAFFALKYGAYSLAKQFGFIDEIPDFHSK